MSIKFYRILASAVLLLVMLNLAGCSLPAETPTKVVQPTELVTILPTQSPIPKQPEIAVQTPTITPSLPTTAPTVTPGLSPLDRKNPSSVIEWIRYGLNQKEISPFSQLAAGKPSYVNYIEGGQPVDQSKLLDDIKTRLAGSTLLCDGYGTYETTLQIWTSGWAPEWQIDKLCYPDCQTVSPPYKSNKAAFFFTPNKKGEYELTTVWLSDSQLWNDVYKVQMHSCSEPYIPPAVTMNCPGAPDARLSMNGYAYASTQTSVSNRVRSAPGTSANVLGLLQPGKAVQITGDPVCVDGFVWWKVKALQGTLTGWTAEGQGNDYWLVPCGGPDNCTP
jgi:hypothetical protein